MTATIEPTLLVSAVLFALGAIGFLTRRNLILVILSAEMMLHGVALSLVTFGNLHGNNEGQIFTIFILTVAACEAGLALALILSLYHRTRSLDLDLWSMLREDDLPSPVGQDSAVEPRTEPEPAPLPRLTPAGLPLDPKTPLQSPRPNREETVSHV
jgi:NADH-quinone oxidoreductase subunit K